MIGIAFIHFLALISPGPDSLYLLSAALRGSRREKILSALGVAAGVILWSLLTAFGIIVVVTRHDWLVPTISFFGALYLMYISRSIYQSRKSALGEGRKGTIGFLGGMITNLTNPKAVLYFTSIFTIYLSRGGVSLTALLALIWIESLAWFLFMVFALSSDAVKAKYNARKEIIDTVIAVIFMLLAIAILVEQGTKLLGLHG